MSFIVVMSGEKKKKGTREALDELKEIQDFASSKNALGGLWIIMLFDIYSTHKSLSKKKDS